jgi:acetyl-CoA acyltransferase
LWLFPDPGRGTALLANRTDSHANAPNPIETTRLSAILDTHARVSRSNQRQILQRHNHQPHPIHRSQAVNEVFICDAVRTPFGRYGGALAAIRTDDLAAIPIRALMARNPTIDWAAVDDVIYGCANQAGEDNRNVARMALLLAGLPKEVPGATVNRLCGSSMDAAGVAARAIRSGETDLMIAGGVESMTRAPFVTAKSDSAFSRTVETFDTTIGWRFVNPAMKWKYGVDAMPETAENVAEEFHVGRADQDAFAFRTQQRWARAHAAGFFKKEIVPVPVPQKKGDAKIFDTDEHPRPDTTLDGLAKLKPIVKPNGTVTAGNASGINDGACALLLASEEAVSKYELTPRARLLATTTVGVAPRIMGFAPAPATKKILQKTSLQLSQIDVIELNEAFAAQALAVTRDLGLPDDAEHVNPNGGAIAIGHPLGASGARLITTAMYQLQGTKSRYALCTMCIGVGQGIATIIERC